MSCFQNVALVTKPVGSLRTELLRVIDVVKQENCNIVLDTHAAQNLGDTCSYPVLTMEEIAQKADVVITLGGDGTMIGAARAVANRSLPIIGINAGRLGFITDILISDIEKTLPPILQGHFVTDKRPILSGSIWRNGKEIFNSFAINDIGVCHGRALGMVEYTIYVDEEQISVQRADGIIVSTSTGSTAYAMSAGGPILHPNVRSMLLVPIAPHTLSNRPTVIHSQSKIEIEINETRSAVASFDAQTFFDVETGDWIRVNVAPDSDFVMLHPEGFSYFELLRRKLHWSYLPRGERPIHVREDH